jgi:hypothetical protein
MALPRLGLVVGALVLCAACARKPASAAAGAAETRPEHNFRFRAPGKAWTKLDPAHVDPAAVLGYTRAKPDVSLLVYAERLGEPLGAERVLDSWKRQLEGRAKARVALTSAALELNGLSGVRAEAVVAVLGAEVAYVDWIVELNGWLYQLIAWGSAAELPAVRSEAQALFAGFELIDSSVRAAPVRRVARPYVSRELGWGMELGPPWMEWRAVQEQVPAAEYGATCGDASLVVAAVPLLGHRPPLDAALGALLGLLDIRPAHELPRAPLRREGWIGYELPYQGQVKGRWMRHRLWALVGEEAALIAAEWRPPEQPDSECADPLERLRLGRARQLRADEVERKPQAARFFAEVARRVSAREKAAYLAAVGALAPQDSASLAEEVRLLQQLGRREEAVRSVAARLHDVPCASPLRAEGAQLLADLGRASEAIATWSSLFGCGYRDAAALSRYLHLLERKGHVDLAFREAQAYADPADLPRLRGELAAADHH